MGKILTSNLASKQQQKTAEMTTNDIRWVETLTVTKLRTNTIVKYWQGHGFLLDTRNDGF